MHARIDECERSSGGFFFSRGISKWIEADGAAEAERLGPLTGCIVA